MVESFELYEGGLGVNSLGWLPLLCTLVVPYQVLTGSFDIPTRSDAINNADGVTPSSAYLLGSVWVPYQGFSLRKMEVRITYIKNWFPINRT